MLRAVARATGLLEKCPGVFICECSSRLPLAMLRLGFKIEGVDKEVDTALKLLRPVASEIPALLAFECRLVEALWGERGLADGVGCPSQPLAR